MDLQELKRILALLALLALSGCGGGAENGGASLAINVIGAKSFDPSAEHGRVEKYEVIVAGEGIEGDIVSEFPGDATEGVVEDVPAGENRRVEVRAVNPNQAVIRAGEATGVKLEGGMNAVDVAMEAVPIFTNLAAGNAVDNTRLVFKVFSDPANPVMVTEQSADGASPVFDASTNRTELSLDTVTGLARLASPVMEPGVRTFAVTDLVTGRQSAVAVRLLEGRGRRSAPSVSAALSSTAAKVCSAPVCAP